MPDGLRLPQRADAWQARPINGRWLRSATRSNVAIGTISPPVDAPRAHEKPRASCKLTRGRFVVATAGDALTGFPVRGFLFSQPPEEQELHK
jgi:hypothetical protein